MTTRYYGIPGVLLDRPFGESLVQTVLYNTPGPPFTVARLGPRKLARAIFTRGPHAMLLLSGFSEDAALTATHAIWGFMALFEGCCPEDNEALMYPFSCVPKTRWNKEQVLVALRQAQPHATEQDVRRLRSGTVLDEVKQHYFRQAVPKILANDTLRESLQYFLECARSFQGFMSDSYYHYHYRHDRSQLPAAELRRRYPNWVFSLKRAASTPRIRGAWRSSGSDRRDLLRQARTGLRYGAVKLGRTPRAGGERRNNNAERLTTLIGVS